MQINRNALSTGGKGYSWEEIKQLHFISDGTIKNYVGRYQVGKINALSEGHYEGNNHKLSAEQIETLANYVDKYNVLTSKQVVNCIYSRFGIKYSVNGMTKLLIRLGLSYKKLKRIPL